MNCQQLLCNSSCCRRPLEHLAWVTLCSHIFCDTHGTPLAQIPTVCSACGAKLVDKTDVHRVNLDPSEQFKSMILAGLRPATVMEVCHRALAFWTYQMKQEQTYQRQVTRRLRERLYQVQAYYEQQLRTRDDQLLCVRRQLQEVHKEQDKCNKELYDDLVKRGGRWSPLPGTRADTTSSHVLGSSHPASHSYHQPQSQLALTSGHDGPSPHLCSLQNPRLRQRYQEEEEERASTSTASRPQAPTSPRHPHHRQQEHQVTQEVSGIHGNSASRVHQEPALSNRRVGPYQLRSRRSPLKSIQPQLSRNTSEEFSFNPAIFSCRGHAENEDQNGTDHPAPV
ncbi:E3 ubiquitin-protein ligase CCNB1IP1-like [Procambarus clarkii]|uniref:E3 ubiquitin-protein ligase CCNB1IP1-like n=1 Tax=Procambarus clarkii TaxID=6728 RepID=UPI003743F98F